MLRFKLQVQKSQDWQSMYSRHMSENPFFCESPDIDYMS